MSVESKVYTFLQEIRFKSHLVFRTRLNILPMLTMISQNIDRVDPIEADYLN